MARSRRWSPRCAHYSACVITGALKGQIDRVWDSFWSGGISNPVEVIEQITYLLFIRRLDDLQLRAEKQARYGGGGVIKNAVFLPGQNDLRWSQFEHLEPKVMYQSSTRRCSPSSVSWATRSVVMAGPRVCVQDEGSGHTPGGNEPGNRGGRRVVLQPAISCLRR